MLSSVWPHTILPCRVTHAWPLSSSAATIHVSVSVDTCNLIRVTSRQDTQLFSSLQRIYTAELEEGMTGSSEAAVEACALGLARVVVVVSVPFVDLHPGCAVASYCMHDGLTPRTRVAVVA